MSYRKLLKNCLSITEFRIRNKGAPEGLRWCNGLCQDFRSEVNDIPKPKNLCKKCINTFNLTEKKILENIITIEDFLENPNIIYDDVLIVETSQNCNTCKENKVLSQFENNRKICKACRAIETINRNKEDIELHIENIEKLKDTIDKLEDYVQRIPKDKLVKIISWFKVGRIATDTKPRMVVNLVTHFKNLQSANCCIGGCGVKLSMDISICGECIKKKEQKEKKGVSDIDFEDNLEIFMTTLEIVKDFDYNVKKLYLIANKGLNLNLKNGLKKELLIQKINTKLEENKKPSKQEEKEPSNLELNGVLVLSRKEDGYVNATALCKAGNKRFSNWYQNEQTKALSHALEAETGIPESQLVYIIKGEKSKKANIYWIHPDLAFQLIQWISPVFALKVSRWIRELSLTGKVRVGEEKHSEGLLELQRAVLNIFSI